jgi:hypothetical protein
MQSLLLWPQSVVSTQGRQILLNDSVYMIRGVCYNPVAIGDDRYDPLDFSHIAYDIELMTEAGINTVRTYVPITDPAVLDQFAEAEIRVIIGFPNYDDTFQYPDINHGTYLDYINTYKDHDAILMWELGNEYNYHPEWFNNDINNWYSILNNAALAIRQTDPNHPVSTAHGEVPTTVVLNLCPNVDVWGMNVYRWDDPSGALTQYAAISSKPCYLSESGADRYDNNLEKEDQVNQAKASKSIWYAVRGNLDICSGITFFAFVDEWWKGGNANTQDPAGFMMSIPYDSFANEEWWGIVDIFRTKTAAYHLLEQEFSWYANDIEDHYRKQTYHLYPNPATDRVMLTSDSPLDESLYLTISTISGTLFVTDWINSDGHVVDIPLVQYRLPEGAYLLRLQGRTSWFHSLLFIQ